MIDIVRMFAAMNIATVGYEKVKAERFLATLRANDITLIVDVRQTPWSNRPDCRKHSLMKACSIFWSSLSTRSVCR